MAMLNQLIQAPLLIRSVVFALSCSCVLTATATELITVSWNGRITSVAQIGDPTFSIDPNLMVDVAAGLTIEHKSAEFPRGGINSGPFFAPGRSLAISPVYFSLVIGPDRTFRDIASSILLSHDATGNSGDSDPFIQQESIQFDAAGENVLTDLDWHVVGGLSTDGNRLGGGESLSAGSTWNSFDNQSLELVLSKPGILGQYRIAIELGEANVVPEPSALCCALMLVSFASIRRRL